MRLSPSANRTAVFNFLIICLSLLACSFTKAQDLQLNGLASYQELNREMFMAGLYLPNTTGDVTVVRGMNEPQRMELRFSAKRVSARRLINLFLQNMAINNSPDSLSENADNMVTFTSLIKGKLLRGDILSFERVPGTETRIVLNSVTLGSVPSSDFFDLLLNTWIGSVPPSTEFKAALLAAGAVSDSDYASFEMIQPTEERIAAVSGKPSATPKPPKPTAPKPQLSAPSIAAPTLEKPGAPTVAAATPIEKPSLPAAPKVEAKPPKAAPKPAAPKPKPEPVAEEEDDSVFDDDEADAPVLTAESILSRQRYMTELVKKTYQKIRYPKAAQRKELEGSVRLRVTIDRKGKVTKLETLEASKHDVLNGAAVKAVGKASPYPNIPADIAGDTFEFVLPIAFRLQ
ncbi:MAG: TonB family protein [Cellvibrionaceae bacterium]